MSFWDNVSQALGTDGGNSGLLPSVSNALGTDGSKNGLLNDPISLAAAAAAAAYFSGGLSLAGESAVNGAVVADATTGAAAATSAGAALVPLEVVAPLGSSAVASVTAGTAASGGGLLSWLGSALTPSNVLTGANLAMKLTSPATTPKASPMYSMPLYGFSGAAPSANVGAYVPQTANPYATPTQSNSSQWQGLALGALAAVLIAKLFK